MTSIAFIGGGNMARSLIGGMAKSAGGSAIAVAEPNAEARESLAREFGVKTFADNAEAVAGAETVVLAVKPQILPKVCQELAETLQTSRPMVISIAAGIRTDQIERWLGGKATVVRCMPNTPALIGAGASGLYANARVSAPQRAQAEHILSAAGEVAWVEEEKLIDVVTGIAGSAPAYFFLMVEALEEAGVAEGLGRDVARRLASQTCLGAGRMMVESGEAPDELRRRVTSPNGTTQAALDSFANDNLRRIVARAVAAARKRGGELADEND
ncbi:pyrroline-5-carboxylate reductase [Oleiagrimonas sp. C23AA]|uniref:pyrroline-5-carboxylate reductase n=1 Tax=Oleiagrimonas sp. C23AA TaxID=2719047 RepID=UPI001422C176|nr:pyrroline-5-carboxylate reductase [Oleiagrimonas sp. C23AA]NII11999.1 pyrroline-5-carboxylate reductase [Oleiagrimonas sp. C23AA]